MTRVAGLDHLTLLGVAPPELVTVSAAAGFGAVGLRVSPATDDERPWPMTPGSAMLAQTALRLADTGIAVLDVEAIRLRPWPGPRPAEFTPVLEAAAELGARFVNAICEDPDLSRLSDEFGRLAEEARPYAVRPVIEFMAYRTVRTLDDAVAIAAGSGGGVLIDALHVQRCGVSLDALRAVDPGLVSYVQLCDAPLAAPPARAPRSPRPATGGCCPAMASSRFWGCWPRCPRHPGGRGGACGGRRRPPGGIRHPGAACPVVGSVPGRAFPGKGAAIVTARLAVRDLKKHYGGVQALRGVSLDIEAGEVLGLVGDNGAGKSTLLKILCGATFASSGEMLLDGQPARFANPAAAQDAGVATVYQDLALAGQRDVVANFFLGREKLAGNWLARRVGWLDSKAMAAHTVSELARLRTRIPDVHLASRDLSGGQRQALAIARAVAWTSKVLLLDEPTSALGVEQQQQVLDLIRRVSGEGIAVLLISHQMPDVLRVCDRAVVLRLGLVAATLSGADLTSENLIGYITGAMEGREQ